MENIQDVVWFAVHSLHEINPLHHANGIKVLWFLIKPIRPAMHHCDRMIAWCYDCSASSCFLWKYFYCFSWWCDRRIDKWIVWLPDYWAFSNTDLIRNIVFLVFFFTWVDGRTGRRTDTHQTICIWVYVQKFEVNRPRCCVLCVCVRVCTFYKKEDA